MADPVSVVKRFPAIPSTLFFRSTMTPLARVLWKPKLIGQENFPRKGPCFIYGNHSNRWDPFMINCFTPLLRPTAGVMTREFFRSKLVGGLFTGVGILPTSKRLAEPYLIRHILRLLKDERAIVIFPEGGARWDGRPMEWIPSTVKLFVRSGVPIHPIRIHGSYASFPRWADHPRPSNVVIEALPPITFERGESVESAIARLRPLTDIDESLTEERYLPSRAYKPAAGVQRILYRDPWDDSGQIVPVNGQNAAPPSGRNRLQIMPDATIRNDSDGSQFHIADLYARIRAMPLPGTASHRIENTVSVHTETEFPLLSEVGTCKAVLADDHVEVSGGTFQRVIDFDDVIYCDIERNFKLQFYLRTPGERMIQLAFDGEGSALQWKDAIERVRPGLVGIAAADTRSSPDGE
ncbi:MAG: 1-acyl-sn-glycerol-3-phosphate acyltransferase [Bacteroidetes bacterium]|nr:1-acyl-sn-glycerol-3-phosphate acyltransferase [Bacteroidota bacterium]